jgi:hypothetical protein
MGTTLTGTTPQDTYDSLIKVTDNGPISGTAKFLSDGLGNDSALALSTAFVGSGTTAISNWQLFKGFQTIGGNAFVGYEDQSEIWSNSFYDGAFKYFANGFGTRFACINGEYDFSTAPENTSGAGAAATFTNRLKITNAGNVGIGTSSPDGKLDVASAGNLVSTGAFTNPHLALTATATTDNDSFVGITYATSDSTNYGWSMGAKRETGGNGYLEIRQHFNSATGTQVARFTGNGLCFGSDTAAANALDDYEEGTWTMGIAFGGAASGVTYGANTGTYTKIGRQVTVNGYLALTSKGSSTGNALMTGLPFTSGSSNSNYAAVSIHIFKISFANQMFARVNPNTTDIGLTESTEAGVFTEITNTNFDNDSEIMVSATYFV